MCWCQPAWARHTADAKLWVLGAGCAGTVSLLPLALISSVATVSEAGCSCPLMAARRISSLSFTHFVNGHTGNDRSRYALVCSHRRSRMFCSSTKRCDIKRWKETHLACRIFSSEPLVILILTSYKCNLLLFLAEGSAHAGKKIVLDFHNYARLVPRHCCVCEKFKWGGGGGAW